MKQKKSIKTKKIQSKVSASKMIPNKVSRTKPTPKKVDSKKVNSNSRSVSANTKQTNSLNDSLLFVKKNNYFMGALIVLLASILFIQLNATQSVDFEEKSTNAINMFLDNQFQIEFYLDSINEELGLEQDELDYFFLESAREDFVWLREKEKEVFNTKPVSDLYAKEAAFSTFLFEIIEINDAVGYRIGVIDYDQMISVAKNTQIRTPTIFSQSKVIELFEGNIVESNIFSNTLNYLFTSYIEFKQNSFNKEEGQSRKYVEAKKLILINEIELIE